MKTLTAASAALAVFSAATLAIVHVILSGVTVGPLAITGLAVETEDYRIIAARGQDATAVVIGVKTPRRTKITDKIRHTVSVSFEAKGRKVATEYWIDDDDLRALFPGSAEGRELMVRYDPEDPRRSAPAFSLKAQSAKMDDNARLFAQIRRGGMIGFVIFAGICVFSVVMRRINKA